MRLAVVLAVATISATQAGAVETGIASVYRPGSYRWGGPLDMMGRKLDFASLTVAHPMATKGDGPVPYGSCLNVHYPRSGRSITARVLDHGPHVKGRVLDMTPAVAKALRFPGRGKVKIERVGCL